MTEALELFQQQGQAAFDREGLPTRKVEQWKYTPLNKLDSLGFGDFKPGDAPVLDSVPSSVAAIDGYRIVLVNGCFSASLSDLSDLPESVLVVGLGEAAEAGNVLADRGLGDQVAHDLPMAALNAAHFNDGVVLNVPKGVALEKPVHLISITVGSEKPTASHPRVLIDIEENAEAVVVESHVSLGDAVAMVNGVTEITVGRAARLGHYKLQSEQSETTHVWMTSTKLLDSSVYDSFVLQLGDGLVRNEIRSLLAGERIEARLNGAYLGTGTAHIDNTTFIDHAHPNCESREVYKGVLDDSARGVFQGKILVRPHAQQTDGHQLNRALLLSPKAEINSKPELEIYADDVKCSHGATSGDLDKDQLFYLKARGISEDQARALLVQAFLMESVEAIQKQSVREVFSDVLGARLTEKFGDLS